MTSLQPLLNGFQLTVPIITVLITEALADRIPSSKEQGVKGGEIAARVLTGEKPESIQVVQISTVHPVVDGVNSADGTYLSRSCRRALSFCTGNLPSGKSMRTTSLQALLDPCPGAADRWIAVAAGAKAKD